MTHRTGAALVFGKDGYGIVADHINLPSGDAGPFKRDLVGFLEEGAKHIERRFLGAKTTHAHDGAALLNGAWDVDTAGHDHGVACACWRLSLAQSRCHRTSITGNPPGCGRGACGFSMRMLTLATP